MHLGAIARLYLQHPQQQHNCSTRFAHLINTPTLATTTNGGPTRPGRRGSHTTTRELQTAPALQTPPKFHEKTPERRRKNETVAGKGRKNAKFWAPPPFGAPLFLGSGPPHPLRFLFSQKGVCSSMCFRCSVFLKNRKINTEIGHNRFGQQKSPQF